MQNECFAHVLQNDTKIRNEPICATFNYPTGFQFPPKPADGPFVPKLGTLTARVKTLYGCSAVHKDTLKKKKNSFSTSSC
jgi:hypothetical protein